MWVRGVVDCAPCLALWRWSAGRQRVRQDGQIRPCRVYPCPPLESRHRCTQDAHRGPQRKPSGEQDHSPAADALTLSGCGGDSCRWRWPVQTALRNASQKPARRATPRQEPQNGTREYPSIGAERNTPHRGAQSVRERAFLYFDCPLCVDSVRPLWTHESMKKAHRIMHR